MCRGGIQRDYGPSGADRSFNALRLNEARIEFPKRSATTPWRTPGGTRLVCPSGWMRTAAFRKSSRDYGRSRFAKSRKLCRCQNPMLPWFAQDGADRIRGIGMCWRDCLESFPPSCCMRRRLATQFCPPIATEIDQPFRTSLTGNASSPFQTEPTTLNQIH